MTPAKPLRSKLLGRVVVLGALSAAFWVLFGSHIGPTEGLNDPDVKALFLDCGNADEPAGTGMPAWPKGTWGTEEYFFRQAWEGDGTLKVEVWQFGNPGLVLTRADRRVKGDKIYVDVRWAAPPQ